jgi:hypothetical protein
VRLRFCLENKRDIERSGCWPKNALNFLVLFLPSISPKKSSMKKRLVFIVFLLASVFSCREDEKASVDPGVIINDNRFEPSKDVQFNGEYLVFPTPLSFEQTIKSISNSDPKSVREWSDQLGFTSIRVIYEKALEEQEKYLNGLVAEYQSLPPNDPRLKVKPTLVQPQYVMEHESLLIFNNQGLIARPALPDYDVTALVNENGLVKVAGHLFQYNPDNIKIIIGGDHNKISALAGTTQTNRKLNIVVNPVRKELVKSERQKLQSSNGRIWWDYSGYSPLYEVGANKYYMNLEIHISYYTEPIYDTTPVCEPEGCGQARIKEGDCNCYYPIVGYTAHTKMENHMETRRIWSGYFDLSNQSDLSQITVNYTTNQSSFYTNSSYTSYNYANTYLTILYNQPGVEFTCADHYFRAVFESGVDHTYPVSWCD